MWRCKLHSSGSEHDSLVTKSVNEISGSIRDGHFLLLTVRFPRRCLVLQIAICSFLCFRIMYKSDFSCLQLSLTEPGVCFHPPSLSNSTKSSIRPLRRKKFNFLLFDLIDLVESEAQLFELF